MEKSRKISVKHYNIISVKILMILNNCGNIYIIMKRRRQPNLIPNRILITSSESESKENENYEKSLIQYSFIRFSKSVRVRGSGFRACCYWDAEKADRHKHCRNTRRKESYKVSYLFIPLVHTLFFAVL